MPATRCSPIPMSESCSSAGERRLAVPRFPLIGVVVAICLTIGNAVFAASPDSIQEDRGARAELATLLDRAEGLRRDGEATQAAQVYRQALTLAERAFGPDHTMVAVVLNGMEQVLSGMGRLETLEDHPNRM